MTIIAFRQRLATGAWSETELRTLSDTLPVGRRGLGWDIGVTEVGDAQFYLLGADGACVVSLSRIGGLYVLEDGQGSLLFEHRSLPLVAAHARSAIGRTRWPVVARIVMVWCAIRHMILDKVEPLMVEGEELLVHVAPQLAAFV